MLVISRRIGESFLIGDNIEATVVDITGEKVVLGITAPKEISITRDDATLSGEHNRAARKGNINMQGFARMYKKRVAQQAATTERPAAQPPATPATTEQAAPQKEDKE